MDWKQALCLRWKIKEKRQESGGSWNKTRTLQGALELSISQSVTEEKSHESRERSVPYPPPVGRWILNFAHRAYRIPRCAY